MGQIVPPIYRIGASSLNFLSPFVFSCTFWSLAGSWKYSSLGFKNSRQTPAPANFEPAVKHLKCNPYSWGSPILQHVPPTSRRHHVDTSFRNVIDHNFTSEVEWTCPSSPHPIVMPSDFLISVFLLTYLPVVWTEWCVVVFVDDRLPGAQRAIECSHWTSWQHVSSWSSQLRADWSKIVLK